MATLTERLNIIIDAAGIGAIGEFKKVGSSAKKELSAVDKAATATREQTGLLSKGLDRLGLSSVDTGTAMKTALAGGATAAGVALIKFSKDGVDAFIKLSSEVKGLQRVTGAGAEDASKLAAALRATGTDSATAEKGFFLLSKTIENTPQKLAKVGVEIAKNKDGSVDLFKTLGNVAEGYQKAGKGAEGNAIAAAAFGKSGMALLPILGKTREELDAIAKKAQDRGLILDQKAIDQGIKYKLAMRDLGEATKGLQIAMGRGLVPIITEVVTAETKLLDGTNKLLKPIGGLSGLIGEVARAAVPGASLLSFLGGKHKDAADSANEQIKSEEDLATALEDSAKEAKAAADEQDKLNRARLDSLESDLAYQRALLSLDGDIASTAETQKKYTDAVAKFGEKSPEAAAAARDLAGANLGLKGDLLGAAEAYARLTVPQGNAVEQALAEITALEGMRAKYPQLREQIDQYIAKLKEIPGLVQTRVSIVSEKVFKGINPFTADGGVFNGAQLRVIGEAGPEAVVPLSPSKRSQRNRVMMQAGLASGWANGGIAGASGAFGVRAPVTVNVTVMMPPGSNGEDVVDAIKRYERRNGIGWRAAS